MTTEVKVTETVTNGQQDRSDYTAEADLARNIASYVSNEKERRCVYLCAKEHLQAMRLAERERIVAWLRSPVSKGSEDGVDWADTFADRIERDHEGEGR